MNKSALQDIQQALNAIRSEIERVDDKTKWAALELILSTSNSVVALAKKMAKPVTKTVTRTVAVPKTKVIKQPIQQTSNPPCERRSSNCYQTYYAPKTVTQPTKQLISVWKILINARLSAVYNFV